MSFITGVAAQTNDIYVPTGVNYNALVEHSMSLIVQVDGVDSPERLWVGTEFKQLPSPDADNFPSDNLYDWLAYTLGVTQITVVKLDPTPTPAPTPGSVSPASPPVSGAHRLAR